MEILLVEDDLEDANVTLQALNLGKFIGEVKSLRRSWLAELALPSIA